MGTESRLLHFNVMAQSIGRLALIGLACASAAAAAACASMVPPLQANLAGTRWTVQAIDGERISSARVPTVNFDAQRRVNGTSGCNSYFGAYSAQDGDLEVSGIGRTEMACAEPLMRQETAFLSALDAAARYVVEVDGKLVIYGRGDRGLTLVRVG
jgi:heat shock protein HslJ